MPGSQSGDETTDGGGEKVKDATPTPEVLLTQRSTAKRAVTCQINHLRQLLVELDSLQDVRDARSKLKQLFQEFQDKHEEYVDVLFSDGANDEDPEIIKCEEYFAERQLAYMDVLRESNAALGLTPLSLRTVTASQQLSATAPPWHPSSANMFPATQLPGASTLPAPTSPATQLSGAPTTNLPAGQQHGMSFHPPNLHPSTNHMSSVSENELYNVLSVLNRPKVELPKFSGDIAQYHEFTKAFDLTMGSCNDFGYKLQILNQCCLGDAGLSIRACIRMTDHKAGYELARATLDDKFGDPCKIAHQIVKSLRTGKPAHNKLEIKRLSADLDSAALTLTEIGMLEKMVSEPIVEEIALRLSTEHCKAYMKKASKLRKVSKTYPEFQGLCDFVRDIADMLDDPIYGEDFILKSKGINKSKVVSYCADVHSHDDCPVVSAVDNRLSADNTPSSNDDLIQPVLESNFNVGCSSDRPDQTGNHSPRPIM